MSTLLETTLRRHPSVYLTEDQLAHLLGGTPHSRYARLKRAVKKGLLVRVKRGLYYLNEELAFMRPHSFELAQFIYGPSYISLESALSYHHLIPEAVYSITSVSLKRNHLFKTPLGEFRYSRLPTENFFIGVTLVQEGRYRFFMASPWKAILDYIYCYKKDWDNLSLFHDSLRVEWEDLPVISREKLDQFKCFYHSRRIDKFIRNVPKEFIDEH